MEKKIAKEEIYVMILTNEIDWEELTINYELTEDIIEEFIHKWDLEYLIFYQQLTENFMRKYKYYLNWYNISLYQKLSESFIKKFFRLGLYKFKSNIK
jgi:hypothetical protein